MFNTARDHISRPRGFLKTEPDLHAEYVLNYYHYYNYYDYLYIKRDPFDVWHTGDTHIRIFHLVPDSTVQILMFRSLENRDEKKTCNPCTVSII